MYNKDITFHSNRNYPTIDRNGSVPYSKGASPATINITAANPDEEYLIINEFAGWRRIVGGTQVNTDQVYVSGGVLRVYLDNFTSGNGVIYWRVYGS